MDGMPYHHEKGETWEFFDSFFSQRLPNVRAQNKLVTLETLWTAPRFTAMGAGAPMGTIDAVWQQLFTALVEHAHDHWFGVTLNNPAGQQPFGIGPDRTLTTGWWKNWYGDAEQILRVSFIRAIEVSLGLAPADMSIQEPPLPAAGLPPEGAISVVYPNRMLDIGTVLAAAPDGTDVLELFARNWPIEVWWTCGPSWFQGWVTWSQGEMGDETGRVTITCVTPGSHDHHIWRDLSNVPQALTPNTTRYGSRLIAHTRNDALTAGSYYPTDLGVVPVPFPLNYSYDPVITVEPTWESGGFGQPAELPPYAAQLLTINDATAAPVGDF